MRDRVDLDRVRLAGTAASASRPRSTRGSASRRVISKKRSRCSESIETLKRATPASTSACGVALEQEAVRRDREVVDAAARASPARRGKSRRTSGSPPVSRTARDAHRGRTARRARSISSKRQDLGALEPRQALGGHAVLAAEVAAVGDRDAQVRDRPAVAVEELVVPHTPSLLAGVARPAGRGPWAHPRRAPARSVASKSVLGIGPTQGDVAPASR